MAEFESAPRKEYLALLNALKRRLRAVDSIAVVHCLTGQRDPTHRPLTLKRADHVWRLQHARETDELATTLVVPKSRDGETITEPITMEIADRVQIDTSRNIA